MSDFRVGYRAGEGRRGRPRSAVPPTRRHLPVRWLTEGVSASGQSCWARSRQILAAADKLGAGVFDLCCPPPPPLRLGASVQAAVLFWVLDSVRWTNVCRCFDG